MIDSEFMVKLGFIKKHDNIWVLYNEKLRVGWNETNGVLILGYFQFPVSIYSKEDLTTILKICKLF